jgi:hypothetical protein
MVAIQIAADLIAMSAAVNRSSSAQSGIYTIGAGVIFIDPAGVRAPQTLRAGVVGARDAPARAHESINGMPGTGHVKTQKDVRRGSARTSER